MGIERTRSLMRRALTVVLLLLALGVIGFKMCDAQTTKICETDLPCIPGTAGKMVHAASHSVLAVAAAETLRLFDKNWNAIDRYMLASVAMPVLWELFDYYQFNHFTGPFPRSSVYDILSYQGAWIVPLIQKRRYWQAALVFIAWGGCIAAWELGRR